MQIQPFFGAHSKIEVAIAILHQPGRFLMQLRDDIPTIRYPGHWAFFGGHLEPGETPDDGISRELLEEINFVPPNLKLYRSYTDTIATTDSPVIRHVYHAPLKADLSTLILNEGWDMDFLSYSDIRNGEAYSKLAQKICPIGTPHQAILLNFIQDVHLL
ncbi:MAG: NUDIX hydrolase [Cyanobacteria bacterium P01_F01_bin.150]